MMMFLALLSISLLLVAVLSLMLYGVAPREPEAPPIRPAAATRPEVPRFFGDDLAPANPAPRIPIDVVLARVERHARLEQAAAESFVEIPAAETLHRPTVSRFEN